MIKKFYQSVAFLFICYFSLSPSSNFCNLEFVTTQEIYNAYQEQEIVEKYGINIQMSF